MTRIFGLSVALLMAVTPAALPQLPRSLIGQGGFEGTLDGWEVDHGAVELDAQQAAAGTGSVRLTDAAALRTPLIPYAQQFLRIAFRMRTEGVERGKEPWNLAGAQVVWYDADRREVGHNDVGLTVGTTDWTLHEGGSFHEAKEGMAYFRVRLMIWDTKGTAWFDDVAVEATEPPAAFRKVPLLSEVEDQVPRFWELPELQPLSGPLDVGTLELNLAPGGGAFIRPATPGAPELGRLDVTLNAGAPLGYGESGVETVGYCCRYRSVLQAPAGYPALETYTEAFRGSPIVSQFMRVYLTAQAQVPRFAVGFEVPRGLTRLTHFEGNALRDDELGASAPRYRLGQTTKPFLVLHTPDDSAGLVIYFPTPPEVRRWHVEDYVVIGRPGLVCRPEELPNGAYRLSWEFRDLAAGTGGYEHSFDLPIYFMPYAGTLRNALREFQVWEADLTENTPPLPPGASDGYWTEWMGGGPGERALRMARYHPREFASWIPGRQGGCYGHAEGHMWGAMTLQMKGVRVDPLAERALLRDNAFRMLHFFIERSNDHGAPPDMSMWRDLAALLPDPERYFTHVFCQYWEFRMGEFRRWMTSPHLTAEERDQVYEALQRAKNVFDPKAPGSWTRLTPGDGYWFDYMDLPLWEGNRWVINTHATSVGVAGQFWLLARERGEADDAQWWETVFRRGVDGLLYALGQDWMWHGDSHDPNELRYAATGGGPRSYHGYMVTAWMPEVIRTAIAMDDYRVEELVAYYRRMMAAGFLAGDEQTLESAREFLTSIGRGG